MLSAILLCARRNSRMAIAFSVSCVPSNVRFYLLVRRATRYEKRLNRFEFEFELASSTSISLNYARPITYLSCSHTTLYYPLHSNTIPFFLIPDSESFIFFLHLLMIKWFAFVALSHFSFAQSSPRTCFYSSRGE